MKTLSIFTLLTFGLLLAACGKPVPPDKASYVGYWQAPNMALFISQDGNVNYKRIEGAKTTTIDAPIKEYIGDNFEVGIGPMTTVFVVNTVPYQEDGDWKMEVDGVLLIKQ